ncbi:MAG: amidohydrolase family protein [Synechococcales bacterium]|nr:amidohydrolase family protein [Synechococcales bacterium]
MFQDLLVIDADAHKVENPLIIRDYIDPEFVKRTNLVVDALGDQRLQVQDFNPKTGQNDLIRTYPQAQGLGKGGFRNLHPETTLGAMFNQQRLAHMDEAGIDIHVIYGTWNLGFSSYLDRDLAVALCKAYNSYIAEDCRGYGGRLKPIGVIPLQDVEEAVKEMYRCVQELGMIGVATAPNIAIPHPAAPEAFPEVRTCKTLSHPDFAPILQAAVDLDIAIGLHGGPGSYLVGGLADHLETFVLSHIFVQRNQQQLALARMIFDGVFEQFPTLRIGFLEGGCGWLPDLAHACHEHWEKRIRDFDPQHPYRPSPIEFTKLMVQERRAHANYSTVISQAKHLFDLLWRREHDPTQIQDESLYEHWQLKQRDPMDYFQRGQIFVSFESDDPSPVYLPIALGEMGKQLACFSGDYGHWDGVLQGCVEAVADRISDRAYLEQLFSGNAIALYGERLRQSLPSQYSLLHSKQFSMVGV